MRTAVFSALLATVASAQTFEVASIKERVGRYGRVGIDTSGTRLTAEATPLHFLVMWAYDVKHFQVVKSPALDAFGSTPYDIQAKAEGDTPPTRAQFRAMLQGLLADRFQLKLHRETREWPVYALIAVKNGPKVNEAAPDASGWVNVGVKGRNYTMTFPGHDMDTLADTLNNSAGLDRPVVDRTGLTGKFAMKIMFTPARGEPEAGDLSIFEALQEQLGLRLTPQSAPIEFLVVDHVAKPSGN
jgi:bla regulator protein blaR1